MEVIVRVDYRLIQDQENIKILTLPNMGLFEQPQILGGTMYPLLVMHVPYVLS